MYEHIKSLANFLRTCDFAVLSARVIPCLWAMAWGKYYLHGYTRTLQDLLFFVFYSIFAFTISQLVANIADTNINKYIKQDSALANGVFKPWILLLLSVIVACYMISLLKPIAMFFAISGIIVSITYPFTRYLTAKPQIIASAGYTAVLLVTYCDMSGRLNMSVFALYIAAIYWSMACDAIGSFRKIKQEADLNIGPTTSFYYTNPKYHIKALLAIMMALLFFSGIIDGIRASLFYFITVFLCIGFLLHIINFTDLNKDSDCRKVFKVGIIIGLILTLAIYYSR